MKTVRFCMMAGLLVSAVIASATAADGGFIAGSAPSQRPAAAPRLTTDPPLDMKRALHGIAKPVPPTIVAFLKDQGGWYNPFIYPGMTGPYDLRGWHTKNRSVSR